MEIKNFQISAVHEQFEVDRIVAALRGMPGVKQATGDRMTKIFIVEYDEPTTQEQIDHALARLGYTVQHSEGW